MVYTTYNISQDAFQAKHRPLTPNIIETATFYTITYAYTPPTCVFDRAYAKRNIQLTLCTC